MALLPWHTCTIINIENTAPHIRTIWIKVPATVAESCIPGQFVTLDLPINEKKNKRWRSYSVANIPKHTSIVELLILELDGGAATHYFFTQAQTGTEVLLRGPQGVFTLPSPLQNPLYLFCTDTGIAPFRAMLQHIQENKIPHQDIHLLYGCPTKDACLFEKEWEALQISDVQFHYHPIINTQSTENDALFEANYVQQAVALLPTPNQSFFTNTLIYICGWKTMVDLALPAIATLGYNKKQVHFELYG